MAASTRLEIILAAKDNASKTLDGLAGKAQNLGGALGGVLKVGAAAGAVAVAGLAVASVKAAAEFDGAMREVNTLLNLGAQDFDALKKSVLDMSAEMGVATRKAVPALYQAISAGVPKDNAIDFLKVASMTAIGGVTDLETAVDGLTTAMNAYGIPASEAESVSDAFFVAMKAGKTTVGELSGALFQVAPIASAAGVSLEETLGAMSALTTAGVPTSVAATQVRAAMQGLLKPSEEVSAIFKEAGYESGQMAIEQLGLAGAMEIMAAAADGDIGALTKLVGSVEGTQAILSLTGAQAETFNGIMGDMATRTGATQTAFDEMNKGASRQWEILKNQLNVALIELGTAVLPLLSAALTAAIPVIASLSQSIRSFTENDLPKIQAKVGEVVAFIQEHWPTISAVLGFAFEYAKTVIEGFIQRVEGIIQIVQGVVGTVKAIFAGDWAAAWENMKLVAEGVLNVLLGTIKTTFGNIPGVILGLAGEAASAAGSFAQGIVDKIVGLIESVPGEVKGMLNEAIRWLNGFIQTFSGREIVPPVKVAGETIVPGVSLPNLPTIPQLATGHPFIPFDNYPALLHRGERVLTAAENRRHGGMGDGPAVLVTGNTINIEDPRKDTGPVGDLAWSLWAAMKARGMA